MSLARWRRPGTPRGASLRYDGLLSRWVFAGYQRQIAMSGKAVTNHGAMGLEGVVVIQDAIPASYGVSGYHAYVLAGRPRDVYRLEGCSPPIRGCWSTSRPARTVA